MKRKFIKSLLLTGLFLGMTACNQGGTSVVNPTSIEIIKENNSIVDLTIEVGQSVDLMASITPTNAVSTVKWSSSNSDVVSVDENGRITGVSKGDAIISAVSTASSYIKKSVFISVFEPVGQKGVGSGHSPDDPIYIGNEGEDEPLEIYFIEMQHIYSDSIFIKKGNVEILIDSGYAYDGNFVSKFMEEHITDGRLDVIMASHSDGDHIEGFENAVSKIDNVSLMIDYGGVGSGGDKFVRDKFIPKGTEYHSAIDCVNFVDGATNRYYLTSEFYFDVLNTGNYIANSDKNAGNANSLAVIFYYKDFKFFTAGDLTSSSEASLMRNEELPEVTLYKASHHGSHGSNTQELLNTLNPRGVAISAARANQYNATPGPANPNYTYNLNAASGHPAAEAISRIYQAPNISENLNVYWNAVNGTMKFTTYGEDSFEFNGSETMKGYYDLTLTDGTPVWNEEKNDFENKVEGEENKKFHETKAFVFRDYIKYLPEWAQKEYFAK